MFNVNQGVFKLIVCRVGKPKKRLTVNENISYVVVVIRVLT